VHDGRARRERARGRPRPRIAPRCGDVFFFLSFFRLGLRLLFTTKRYYFRLGRDVSTRNLVVEGELEMFL
jgi:hypothetical protein